MKNKALVLLAVLIVAAVGLFLFLPTQQLDADELAGNWRGGGAGEAGEWWVEYTFDNGSYEMTTGTDYEEVGTYQILERFEDGSMIVRKIFGEPSKIYDTTIVVIEDGSEIFIEGMALKLQERK